MLTIHIDSLKSTTASDVRSLFGDTGRRSIPRRDAGLSGSVLHFSDLLFLRLPPLLSGQSHILKTQEDGRSFCSLRQRWPSPLFGELFCVLLACWNDGMPFYIATDFA